MGRPRNGSPALVALSALLAAAAPPPLAAHELVREVTRGVAVVISLSYPDGTAFSYEQYEIHRDGEEIPFQTGRSDARGRIVFVPDRPGSWRIRTFSEDGHGADFTLEAGPEGAPAAGPAGGAGAAESGGGAARLSGLGRGAKILVGLSVLFGVFGVVSLFSRRRAT